LHGAQQVHHKLRGVAKAVHPEHEAGPGEFELVRGERCARHGGEHVKNANGQAPHYDQFVFAVLDEHFPPQDGEPRKIISQVEKAENNVNKGKVGLAVRDIEKGHEKDKRHRGVQENNHGVKILQALLIVFLMAVQTILFVHTL